MKPATPLPWQFNAHYIYSEATKHVAAGRQGLEDAAYIVHAANAYPRLVEALREVLDPTVNVGSQTRARSFLAELEESA